MLNGLPQIDVPRCLPLLLSLQLNMAFALQLSVVSVAPAKRAGKAEAAAQQWAAANQAPLQKWREELLPAIS